MKKKIMDIVEKVVEGKQPIYFGIRSPDWIRVICPANAGDTVTVGGIPKRVQKKAPYAKVEGYGVIDRKRVYNGSLLCYDGSKWIHIDGGKRDDTEKPHHEILRQCAKKIAKQSKIPVEILAPF